MTIHLRPLLDGGWEARGSLAIAATGPSREDALTAFFRALGNQAHTVFPIVEWPPPAETETETDTA